MDVDRFRIIAEYNRDVLLLARPGQVEWVSPGASAILGWVPGEMVGKPFIGLVHPDDVATVVKAMAALSTGGVAQVRCRMLHGDGSYHWWESRAQGVPDPDGRFTGLSVSSWRLVDDDMAVLHDLRVRDRWLQLVAENSIDVIVLLRDDGEVEWISRPVGIRESITPEMVVGTSPWGMIHPDDRVAAMEALARVARDGRTDEVHLRFEEAPGIYRWLAANGHRLADPALPGRIVVSFRDIDDERYALQLLTASEHRYRTLAENATDVVYALSLDGTITWVSPSIQEIFGWRPEQMVGQFVRRFMHPDDLSANSPRRDAVMAAGGDGGQAEIRFLDADGQWRWVGLTGRVLRDVDGNPTGGIESLRDISAEMTARVALEDSERQFRLAMHGSPEGMAVVGLDRRFLSVNPALARSLGHDAGWFAHRCIDEIVHPADLEADHAVRARLLADEAETQAQERRLIAADGSQRWVLHSVGLLRDHELRPLFFVSHFQDITARKRAEQDLEFAATHDPLTGLSNRTNLVEEIRRALSASHRSQRPTAVVMLDLDHFKFVNDSLGHATGDELIRQAAERIRATVREGDLVARQGGDEFVVVMRDLDDPTEAMRVGQRLVDAFRRPVLVNHTELFTTASVGVSVSRGGTDVDALLAEADTAMYVAKDDGRDRVSLFNDELRAAVTERLRIESGLRHALERDEFRVWYQPEVDLRTGALTAVEALLRWEHPDGDFYSADAFIEVAEDSGLIVDIGATVIRRACGQAAMWAAAWPERDFTVRVNLSTRQLAEAELLQIVDDALLVTRVDPGRLCFEITETAILRDIPTVATNLRGIHQRGIALAVDDFGTGYASLTYLRQLPISVLKLDRSFVVGIAVDDFDRRLVSGVIGLARNLGITVTAEGVENPEQADMLRALGCRRAQGYLYSRAVSAAEIDRLLSTSGSHPSQPTFAQTATSN